MMEFRKVKTALVQTLGTNAFGRFRVVGFRGQKGTSETTSPQAEREVRVFYRTGQFPKSGSSASGPVIHDGTFAIEMRVSKSAVGNLAVLEDETSSDAQRASVLGSFQEAADAADLAFDEFLDDVYQVLMSNVYRYLDIIPGLVVSNRWIDSFEKDPPSPKGDKVVLTGGFKFECRMSEELTGELPLAVNVGDEINLAVSLGVSLDDLAPIAGVGEPVPEPEPEPEPEEEEELE